MHLEGLDAMLRRLDELDRRVRRQVLRKPIADVTRAVARDVKARLPKDTGALRKAIGTRITYRDGLAAGEIGARRGKGGPHLHLVEFGTVGRVQRSTGRRTGTMPARPTLRPALAAAARILPIAIRNAFRQATGAD